MGDQILTNKDAERIISKSIYWNEVFKRERPGNIPDIELMEEVYALGAKKVLKLLQKAAQDFVVE